MRLTRVLRRDLRCVVGAVMIYLVEKSLFLRQLNPEVFEFANPDQSKWANITWIIGCNISFSFYFKAIKVPQFREEDHDWGSFLALHAFKHLNGVFAAYTMIQATNPISAWHTALDARWRFIQPRVIDDITIKHCRSILPASKVRRRITPKIFAIRYYAARERISSPSRSSSSL